MCLAEVNDVEFKVVLNLPRDAASVPLSRHVLDGSLQTLGVTDDTRTDIALALSEACANVIVHASSGEQYGVTASIRGGRCVIEVENSGTAPVSLPVPGGHAPVSAEHGRGLTIMDAVVDNLRLTGNRQQGTTVHFEKALQWIPGAAGEHLSRNDG